MTSTERKKGRPFTAPDGTLRVGRMVLRLSEGEWEALRAAYEASGYAQMADWVRRRVLRGIRVRRG